MSRTIRSYKDLAREQRLLEELLQAQRELISHDFQQLKYEAQPVVSALGLINKMVRKDKNNFLLNEGAGRLIDGVVKNLIPARSGWLTRLAIPFFLKNYSSHYIAEHKDEWIQKLSSFLHHRNGDNGHDQLK